jgi:hypothetical protein
MKDQENIQEQVAEHHLLSDYSDEVDKLVKADISRERLNNIAVSNDRYFQVLVNQTDEVILLKNNGIEIERLLNIWKGHRDTCCRVLKHASKFILLINEGFILESLLELKVTEKTKNLLGPDGRRHNIFLGERFVYNSDNVLILMNRGIPFESFVKLAKESEGLRSINIILGNPNCEITKQWVTDTLVKIHGDAAYIQGAVVGALTKREKEPGEMSYYPSDIGLQIVKHLSKDGAISIGRNFARTCKFALKSANEEKEAMLKLVLKQQESAYQKEKVANVTKEVWPIIANHLTHKDRLSLSLTSKSASRLAKS